MVFLDDDDRKMILVRATGRVQEMDTCGIAAAARFAFYDQVHTTGMDIQHSLDATAVLTLGKDMNFRDYVQGSFRMRGIGQGQKVSIYIIPEVAQLIDREIKAASMAATADNMLEQVTAWLVIRSMRSERVQNNQLMVQNVANVWRKEAFREVKANCNKFEDVEKHQAVAAFCAGLSTRLEESKRSNVEESIAAAIFVDHLPIVVPLKVKKLDSMMRNSVFKRVQSKITRIEIPTDASGRTQGMAFVEFASEDDAMVALSTEGEYTGKQTAGHKPDGFQFDKQHILKACPLKEQVVSSEDQTLVPQSVLESLRVFEEDIDFSLAGKVPEPVPFDEVLQTQLDAHARWLDAEKTKVVQDIVDSVRGSRISNHQASLEAEQTQEQEEEREKELEDEKEKEIEIEKFSDAAYSRDNEAPVPWDFATLADPSTCDQFYGADEFKLFKRKALQLPTYVQFSQNYFCPKWSGERRLKNVVMLMEWVPAIADRVSVSTEESLTEEQEQAIDRAIELFVGSSDRLVRTMTQDDATTVMTVIQAACDLDIDREELRAVVRQFRHEQTAPQDSGTLARTMTSDQEKGMQLLRVLSRQSSGGSKGLDRDGIRRLLLSAKFRETYTGHFTVAVSLSEAATIRRIMHLRSQKQDLVVDGKHDTALALRVLPAGNVLLDSSLQFKQTFLESQDSRDLIRYQQEASCEVMRFINCDMHYSEAQLNMLLRLLKYNTERERRRFFALMIGCRRRLQLKYENTPVVKLFTISDEWALLKQRALSAFFRERLAQLGTQYGDAFEFIRGTSGPNPSPIIKAQHMLGAFTWLGDNSMTPRECVDFIRVFDKDKDGGWNFDEFMAMLNTQVDADADDIDDVEQPVDAGEPLLSRSDTGSTYDYIMPMRTVSIARLEVEDAKTRQLEQEAEEQSEREEREAMIKEALAEEERLNLSQPGGPNPRIEYKTDGQNTTPWKFTWNFTRPRDPKGMKWGGSGNVSTSAVRTAYPEGEPPLQGGVVTRAMGSSYIRLPIERKPEAQDRGSKLDKYSVSLHLRLETSLPKGKEMMSLLATKDNDATSKAVSFVFIDSKGDVRFGDGSALFGDLDDVRVHIKRARWYVVSITVDATEGSARVWVNGKPHCTVEGAVQIKRQGMHSLGDTACIFGSSEKKEMQGIKLITMMSLQLNVLDDDCAKAVYDGPAGFVGPKGSAKAGEVRTARLHSALGYEEAEARISRLIEMFAANKRFSRAEVVDALTALFQPKAKGKKDADTPVKLTPANARDSMIGCRVEYSSDEQHYASSGGKGKLLGYKADGVRVGDTSGGLQSDGYCRIMFESGHPSSGGQGEYNVPMSGTTVFAGKEVDTAKYKTVTKEDGTPSRDFEIGSTVKKEPPQQPSGPMDDFGFFGGPGGGRRARRAVRAAPPGRAGGQAGGANGTPISEDVPATEVFEVVTIGLPEETFEAARMEGLIQYEHSHDGSEIVKSDFLVLKPLSADVDAFEKMDDFVASLTGDKYEDLDAPEFLAKWGIFSIHEVALAVSNSPQQVGDMYVAMSNLRERAGLDEEGGKVAEEQVDDEEGDGDSEGGSEGGSDGL